MKGNPPGVKDGVDALKCLADSLVFEFGLAIFKTFPGLVLLLDTLQLVPSISSTGASFPLTSRGPPFSWPQMMLAEGLAWIST